MKKSILKKYAQLIAETGLNVQKDQDVIIFAGLDQPEFVKMVVEACYKRKARKVTVQWSYPELTKLDSKYCSLKTLSTISKEELARLETMAESYPCRLFIDSDDPDALKGANQEKLLKARAAKYPITKKYRDAIENKHQWCIVGVPGKKWAKKVFPSLPVSQAMEKLWDNILTTARVTDDPIKAWEEHDHDLKSRCRYLNDLGIDYLEYHNSLGTNFKVWLLEDSVFMGGGSTLLNRKDVIFQPNIPSEECFTSPMRGKAEGIVYSALPLSYNGELIENFNLTFKDGHVVEAHAEKGEELLNKMIHMDESASYLGEVALVPFTSPINQTGTLFYNTLYDENAVCHLALGMGFDECVKDFEKYTHEEILAKGINDSMIHVDFMIGTSDLDIKAHTKDGKIVQIFKNGVWAF